MREKTMELMDLTMVPFEKNLDGLLGQFESQLKAGFGADLPSDARDAIEVVRAAFIARKGLIESSVANILEQQYDASEMEALVTFYLSAVGMKMQEVSPKLQYDIACALNQWVNATMSSIEPRLRELLGTEEPTPLRAETPESERPAEPPVESPAEAPTEEPTPVRTPTPTEEETTESQPVRAA